jgi:hypothetical protein
MTYYSNSKPKPRERQDRLPPHSTEAEQGVLGCILLSPGDCLSECVEKLKPGHLAFYDVRHQALFQTMMEMRVERQAIDLITLQQRLKNKGQMEGVGGLAYLCTLPDMVPSAANLQYYLDIVLEKYRLRKLLQTCTDIAGRVFDHEGDTGEFLTTAKADLNDCLTGKSELPSIVDGAGFIQEQIATPAQLVEGILHRGSKLVLGGASKSHKTWTLLDLALSVATGEPWLSCKTTKGRVLYLNFEIQEAFFQNRVRAVAEAKRITLSPSIIALWNLRGQAAGYAHIFPRIIERVRDAGYALIVLDPIYKCYGDVDENSAGAVGMLMNAIEGLAVETGAAVAFGAHYSKGNQAAKEAIDRISGSGVFARDPDSILSFTRHEAEDAFTVELTLRNFKPVAPFVARWIYPLMRRDETLDPAKLKKCAGGSSKSYTVEMLVNCLGNRKLKTASFQKLCADEAGITRPTFYRLIREAQSAGAITKDNSGKWMVVSTGISGINATTDTVESIGITHPLGVIPDTE